MATFFLGYNTNGKGDACRHAVWNCLIAAWIGTQLTKQLTDAHENIMLTYPFQEKEVQMDLFNNQFGRDVSSSLDFINGHTETKILYEMQSGNLRYLNNLNAQGHPTSNSQLIPTNQ